MTPEDPITRLLAVLQGLDLTSADGRAGIGTLLAEVERPAPERDTSDVRLPPAAKSPL